MFDAMLLSTWLVAANLTLGPERSTMISKKKAISTKIKKLTYLHDFIGGLLGKQCSWSCSSEQARRDFVCFPLDCRRHKAVHARSMALSDGGQPPWGFDLRKAQSLAKKTTGCIHLFHLATCWLTLQSKCVLGTGVAWTWRAGHLGSSGFLGWRLLHQLLCHWEWSPLWHDDAGILPPTWFHCRVWVDPDSSAA